MSCIATFYVLALSKREDFLRAKEGQARVEVRQSLMIGTTMKKIGDQYLWEYLKREASIQRDLPFSGFLIVEYQNAFPELVWTNFFEDIGDDYASLISADKSKLLHEFLSSHSPDPAALSDSYGKRSHAPEIVEALIALRGILLEWCSLVATDSFGVLYLSF